MEMEKIIMEMIEKAEQNQDYELIEFVKKLINTMALTINCPSDWRYIAGNLRNQYDIDEWVYEMLELWNYGD